MGLPARNFAPATSPFDISNPRPVSVFLLGCGVVGGELLRQIATEAESLRLHHGVDVQLVGVANSRVILQADDRIDPETATRLLEGDLPAGVRRSANTPSALGTALRRFTCEATPVLVDATASDDHTDLFQDAIDLGVHVVTANKKPLVVSQRRVDALATAARRRRRALRCETTVGAGLPVIETLRTLRRTGDRIHRVEGSLSGTLGYVSGETSRGVALSVAVRKARELGYAEPHPAEDLSGEDVARKGLIVGREIGLKIELDDVVVEPLVPHELLAIEDVDDFLRALEAYDAEFDERIRQAAARGKVVRYLATIDPAAETKVRVGPVEVDSDHVAATLDGTEALVTIRTERYRDFPLTIRGPGAGGPVTASGILAEVIDIATR